MNCTLCGKKIPIDYPVIIALLENPPVNGDCILTFCMNCEDNIPDPAELHMLANKQIYYKD